MIKYRPLNLSGDYPVLASFFKKSKMGVPPPADMLPANGIVSETHEGMIVGALFMYLSYPICILGFPILDPDFKGDRGEVVNEMISQCNIIAKYNGINYSNTWSNLDHVQDRFILNGFNIGDDNVTQLIKRL